ncbi:MAG: hypothetical protein Q9225_005914 [Loekoesia sp. 1 TL-2023]
MSDNIPTYTIFLLTVNTEDASRQSIHRAGYSSVEEANESALAWVASKSGVPTEDWDEYDEETGDQGQVTIRGAIDTLQIICFVWIKEREDEKQKGTEQATETEDSAGKMRTDSQEKEPKSMCESVALIVFLALVVCLKVLSS